MRALLLFAAIAVPALAQMPAAPAPPVVCIQQEIVQGFEKWGRGPAAPALSPGVFASLKLLPATAVGFAPPLKRPPAPGSFGGNYALHVIQAGRYSVALSAGAWIEMVDNGKPLVSVAHRHGPACSGIGKIVTFALEPGDYVVQLSEAKTDGIMAMVSDQSR